jgi:hypothetical protein
MYYKLIIVILLILLILYFKTIKEHYINEGEKNILTIIDLLSAQNIKIDASKNVLIRNANNTNSTIKFENGNLKINDFISYDPIGNLKFGDYTYDPSGNITNKNISGKLRVENNFIKLNDDITYDTTGVLRFKDYVYDSLGQKKLSNLTTYSQVSVGANTVNDNIYDEIQIIKYAADNNDNNPLRLAHIWFNGDNRDIPYDNFDSITPINMYIKNSQNIETLYLPTPNEFMCYLDGCSVDTSSVSGKNNMDNGYTIKFKTPIKIKGLTLYNNYAGRRGILNTKIIGKRANVVLSLIPLTTLNLTYPPFYTNPTSEETNITAATPKPLTTIYL